MTDERQTSGYRSPPRRTERRRGDLVDTFTIGDTSWSVELFARRDVGVEAQLFEGDELRVGRLWAFREQAIEWARRQRREIEAGRFE